MLNCPKSTRDRSGHLGQTCKHWVSDVPTSCPDFSGVGTSYKVAKVAENLRPRLLLDSYSKTDQFMSCPKGRCYK